MSSKIARGFAVQILQLRVLDDDQQPEKEMLGTRRPVLRKPRSLRKERQLSLSRLHTKQCLRI